MPEFIFETDAKGYAFCREIAVEMVKFFKISDEEAVGRINRQWKNAPFTKTEDIAYHETAEYWAKAIYFGKDSYWWKGEENLKPIPYP
jgi:hypothetical protein